MILFETKIKTIYEKVKLCSEFSLLFLASITIVSAIAHK